MAFGLSVTVALELAFVSGSMESKETMDLPLGRASEASCSFSPQENVRRHDREMFYTAAATSSSQVLNAASCDCLRCECRVPGITDYRIGKISVRSLHLVLSTLW